MPFLLAGSVIGIPYIESYNPLTDTWTKLNQIQEPRAEFGAAILANKLYMVGGYSWDRNARLNSAEVYDLQQNQCEILSSISKPYTGISSCALHLYERLDGGNMYEEKDEQPAQPDNEPPPTADGGATVVIEETTPADSSQSIVGKLPSTPAGISRPQKLHLSYSDDLR